MTLSSITSSGARVDNVVYFPCLNPPYIFLRRIGVMINIVFAGVAIASTVMFASSIPTALVLVMSGLIISSITSLLISFLLIHYAEESKKLCEQDSLVKKELLSEINTLRLDNSSFKSENVKLLTDNQHLEKRLSVLMEELEDASSELEELMHKSTKDIQAYESYIEEISEMILSYKIDLDLSSREKSRLSRKVQAMQEEIDLLRQQVEQSRVSHN
ncbi:hypothetical protein CP10139811_0515 [Chlamydia ibidis]|uniref:IncA family protein n=2 Tax=Chlamydia ibidis TaxID=1405396 RepID=S7KEI9_9CHLA|nr:hypothetical protein [Chlamydia ibidis]EPP34611.1 hypothetical protein CP10139811_0515 [Chlamydia ibidis]EQM62470.1 hypothetical protein H359_0894 [Chlamydia ibidis 10-1398/6]